MVLPAREEVHSGVQDQLPANFAIDSGFKHHISFRVYLKETRGCEKFRDGVRVYIIALHQKLFSKFRGPHTALRACRWARW